MRELVFLSKGLLNIYNFLLYVFSSNVGYDNYDNNCNERTHEVVVVIAVADSS